MAWTDERLDDLANRMDAGFARTERDMRELRTELKGDIAELRTELKGDIVGLKGEVDGLRGLMVRFGIAIMVCLAGVIATLIGVIATGSVAG